MDVPMELSRILITEYGDQQVIVLKEKSGERSFPIIIGIAEALAIDRRLKGVPTPRPMTHDLMGNVIEAMGGEVEKVVVNDLRDRTFIATLYIARNGENIEVDARPSDAIALGIGLQVPIFVADHVLDNVLAPPSTKAERIEMLRQRLTSLSESISETTELLESEEFLANAPDEVVEQHRRRLEEMQTEYDAIEEVLDKLG